MWFAVFIEPERYTKFILLYRTYSRIHITHITLEYFKSPSKFKFWSFAAHNVLFSTGSKFLLCIMPLVITFRVSFLQTCSVFRVCYGFSEVNAFKPKILNESIPVLLCSAAKLPISVQVMQDIQEKVCRLMYHSRYVMPPIKVYEIAGVVYNVSVLVWFSSFNRPVSSSALLVVAEPIALYFSSFTITFKASGWAKVCNDVEEVIFQQFYRGFSGVRGQVHKICGYNPAESVILFFIVNTCIIELVPYFFAKFFSFFVLQ